MNQGVIMGWATVWLFVSVIFHSTQPLPPLSLISGADLKLGQLSQLNYIIDTYLFVAASALAASAIMRR